MSNFSVADVPTNAKQAVINAVNKGGDFALFAATVILAFADLKREYPEILVNGESNQKETWEKYLPELEVALITDGEVYAEVLSEIYEEYADKELRQAVNEFLAANLPVNEEVQEWTLVLDNGVDEPFVVSSFDGGSGVGSDGIVLTDLPDPAGAETTYADAEPGSVYDEDLDNEARLDAADREEEAAQAFLKENPGQEELPKEFDLEAQADNVVPISQPGSVLTDDFETFPTVTPDAAPAQPKWDC